MRDSYVPKPQEDGPTSRGFCIWGPCLAAGPQAARRGVCRRDCGRCRQDAVPQERVGLGEKARAYSAPATCSIPISCGRPGGVGMVLVGTGRRGGPAPSSRRAGGPRGEGRACTSMGGGASRGTLPRCSPGEGCSVRGSTRRSWPGRWGKLWAKRGEEGVKEVLCSQRSPGCLPTREGR